MITKDQIRDGFANAFTEIECEIASQQEEGIAIHMMETHGLTWDDISVVIVPATFWDDHIARECEDAAHGVAVQSEEHLRWSAEGIEWVSVVMERSAIMELMSDARHYSSGYDEEDYGDLMESARLTRDALLVQSPLNLFGIADA
jgi:hypothetical protein